eukprot:1159996-Pelagomonas_calceolata.AAC.5
MATHSSVGSSAGSGASCASKLLVGQRLAASRRSACDGGDTLRRELLVNEAEAPRPGADAAPRAAAGAAAQRVVVDRPSVACSWVLRALRPLVSVAPSLRSSTLA